MPMVRAITTRLVARPWLSPRVRASTPAVSGAMTSPKPKPKIAWDQRLKLPDLPPSVRSEKKHSGEARGEDQRVERAMLRVVGVGGQHKRPQAGPEEKRADPVDLGFSGRRRAVGAPGRKEARGA